MSTMYTVNTAVLNVREGPGTKYDIVTTVTMGTTVVVSQVTNGFGKIGSDKWVSMDYLNPVSSELREVTALEPSFKPNSNPDNRPIYFLQTDSRWRYVLYTAIGDTTQTIGSSGCGPSAMSMVINDWIDPSYGPREACAWSLASGYRTTNNGTAWAMFKAIAVKYGLKFLQTAYAEEAIKFMEDNPEAMVVCSMGKGNWASSGHFILMYDYDGKYVYINDPASTAISRQKNTFSLLKSQCRQYFCFAISEDDKAMWAEKIITNIPKTALVVASFTVAVRKDPSTSTGGNIIGKFTEGTLVYATKKCGDWYYVSGVEIKTGKTLIGWCPANCLEEAHLGNVNSDVATLTKEAIDYLVDVGFLNTPDFWASNIFKIDYLTNMIIAIARAICCKKIKEDPKKSVYTEHTSALKYLNKIGVINTPEYWNVNINKISNMNHLFVKAANWLC